MESVPDKRLRRSILLALSQAGDAQDLAAIHTLLNRPQKDISLLPIVGGLVSSGYLEKVTTPKSSPFPNAPLGSHPNKRVSQPVPVRFRLTDEGRNLIKSSAEEAFSLQIDSFVGAEFDSDEQDSEPVDDINGDE